MRNQPLAGTKGLSTVEPISNTSALGKIAGEHRKRKHGLAFASGLAAMDAIMKLLQPDDEVISTNDLMGAPIDYLLKSLKGLV